jgi:hypothetical protein
MKTEKIFNIVSDAYWSFGPIHDMLITRKAIDEYTINGVEFSKGVRYVVELELYEENTCCKSQFVITMRSPNSKGDYVYEFQSNNISKERVYQELISY